MRTLLITGEYPAMQGGMGDYTRQLGQALGTLGIDTHVLTHVDAGADHLRQPAAPYEPTVYATLTGRGWPLWGHVRQMAARVKPDILHIQYQSAAYDLHPAVNLLPYWLRRCGITCPIVTTFHDLRYPYLFPKAGPLRWQAVLTLARGSDAVVITNPDDWEQLAGTTLLSKMNPIPIGSNIHCQPPTDYDRRRQRARWQVGDQDWLLAYFGFLNPSKGGETLVQALASLRAAGRPAHLLMVGGTVGASDPTNAAYLARVETLIDELHLAQSVHWTGFTSPDEVSANLLAADCAVLPYLEGASLRHGSLMAAMAHGLPIVTTHTPGTMPAKYGPFPSLENNTSALLVPPNEPNQLADAVTRVMNDGALRQALGQKARQLSQQFEWQAIAQHHLRLYQWLLGRAAA